jgi:nitroreductase / dihydropteridine reductase
MSFLQNLNWRYATKKYDASAKVPQEKLDQIIEAIVRAPTSSGLQPFEVILVKDKVLREKLRAASYDQSQVTDASDFLVFAAWDTYTTERITKIYDQLGAERGGLSDSVKAYRDNLIKNYTTRSAEVNFEHAARQAYIGLGFALAAAAELKVDTTPMEGFDAKAFDEILGLHKKGLRTVVVMAVGHRDAANDWLVNLKKVRRPKAEMIHEVN